MSKELEQKIKDLESENKTLSDALDRVDQKIAEYDAKFEAMANVVESSVSFKDADKPKPIADPGVVKIGDKSYKFTSLRFSVPNNGDIVNHLASDVAKDADLCADLLKNHPSVFTEVSKTK